MVGEIKPDDLYRKCPGPKCHYGTISEYEQGPNATHTSRCWTCNGIGFVRVDAPAPTDALRAAAQAVCNADVALDAAIAIGSGIHSGERVRLARTLNEAVSALRAALDGVPAPVALTEEELESLAAAALDRMEMSVEAHEWVDPEQLLDIEGDGSDVEDWNGDYVKWDVAQSGYRIYGVRARDAVLANLREMRPELDWLVAK